MTQREDREYARKTLISPSNDFSKTRCSLSMKMRSESVGGSLSRPSTTYAGLSGTLPELKKRRSSNIHLPPTIPKSDVAMMYEKLSGLFETEGFEAFPSRGTVVHPTTLCVRCASHASLCVPCADIMTQEAVAFFRKSQAVGAYHLLDGAIKQAGAQKVLRFIVFRCWKNSIRLRKYGRDKRELFTTRAWHLTLMKAPFRNWVIYTRECQFERRDKKIEQLEDKVRVLEQQVLKLSADKNVMEKQVRNLLVEKSESEMFAASQRERIKELEDMLALERFRLARLGQHVEASTPQLVSLVKSAVKSQLAGAVRHINLTQTINLAALNMSKVLKAAGPGAKPKAGADKPPDGPGEQLLAWTNYMSRSAVGVTVRVTSGETLLLDDYLPILQPAKTLESLKSGRQIARVVLRMVALLVDVPLAPPKPARPPRPAVPPPTAPTSAPNEQDTPVPMTLSIPQLEELRENGDVPHSLLYFVLAMIGTYLKGPSFPLERIVAGRIDSIEVLVTYLMLVWADMPGHTLSKEERTDSNKVQEKQAAILRDMETLCESRCRANALKIAELSTSSTEQSDNMKGAASSGDPPTGPCAASPPWNEEQYMAIGDAVDAYLREGGAAEKLTESLLDVERGIRDVTDFTNSVYMKQKTAAAGLQFTLNTTRQHSLNCTKKMLSTSGWVKNAKVENTTDISGQER